MPYYLYILRCADRTLYTGITTDLDRRVAEHNLSTKGAKYTRARRPVVLVYSRQFATRSEATKAEAAFKKLTRTQKLALIKQMGVPKRPRKKVVVKDKMQTGFYYLSEPAGRNFDPRFRPELTPAQMLALGVFGGKYMTDCRAEFPASWYKKAKLCPERHDPQLNYFKINASQSLAEWRRKDWIHPADPRGWFQWYCRYYLGRRMPEEDNRQIKRWLNMRRHIIQVQRHCQPGDLSCRPRQRQSLLHWAYDSRRL